MATWNDVLELGKALPGVVEGTSYGTPALKAGKTFLTRFRAEDDSIVLHMPFDEREIRLEADPDLFFITDHYRNYPTVLLRLKATKKAELKHFLTTAYRAVAPRKLVKQLDAPPA